MKQRTVTGIIAAILLLVIYLLPDYIFSLTIYIISLWMNGEFLNSGKNRGIQSLKKTTFIWTTILYLGISLTYLVPSLNQYNYVFMYCAAGLFIINIMASAMLSNKYTLNDMTFNLMGWFYTSFLLSFVLLIRFEKNGSWLLLFLIIGAFITDIFAYYTGYLFGKHKIIPRISPKKTIEGSIGGLVFCLIFTFGYSILYKYITSDMIPIYKIILIGVLSGVLSQIGDWSASYIKRQLGVKDFGTIMPGHGGMLDRLDSILFLAPIIFLIIKI
ncbi:MAG: phosphatidate cytidylyltransferase [Clostridia bacterium]|nr:phosphatidate cytidylyltransferase [Clostridia bacterium]